LRELGGTVPERQPPDGDDLGGERACFIDLVCPECGGVTNEGHSPGCEADPRRLDKD